MFTLRIRHYCTRGSNRLMFDHLHSAADMALLAEGENLPLSGAINMALLAEGQKSKPSSLCGTSF
jgi:hypothetical protein